MSSSETVGHVLDGLLDEWYQASVLGQGNVSDVTTRYQKLKNIHTNIDDEVSKRLASLDGIEDQRCFITMSHRNFLQKVLNVQSQSS